MIKLWNFPSCSSKSQRAAVKRNQICCSRALRPSTQRCASSSKMRIEESYQPRYICSLQRNAVSPKNHKIVDLLHTSLLPFGALHKPSSDKAPCPFQVKRSRRTLCTTKKVEERVSIELNENDLIEEFVKGSGKGGQKVNKSNNAVFLKHKPTGLWVKSHPTRMLGQNRKIARQQLADKIDQMVNGEESKKAQQIEKLRKKKQKRALGGATSTIIRKLDQEALSSPAEDDPLWLKFKSKLSSKTTVQEALEASTEYLSQKLLFREVNESEEEWMGHIKFEASVLLADTLNIEREFLLIEHFRELSSRQRDQFAHYIHRRARCEPVSYILGYRWFWKHKFFVQAGVLIPRPCTELLVEHTLRLAKQFCPSKQNPLNVLELGVGSGAPLLSILADLPPSRGVAVDASQVALQVAQKNAHALGLTPRVQFVLSDWIKDLPLSYGPFHFIITNPPYVLAADRARIDPSISQHEPSEALFAGDAGLDCYLEIASQFASDQSTKESASHIQNTLQIGSSDESRLQQVQDSESSISVRHSLHSLLVEGGYLLVEIGKGQGRSVQEIFLQACPSLRFFDTYCDLDQIERCLIFQKNKN